MKQQIPKPKICACVLAAGRSSRFGASKLVQQFRGKPLVQNALLAAQDACEGRVYLVVGHDQESVIEAAAGLFDRVIVNKDFGDGIGTSIAAAVRVCRNEADAILIALADQPLVTAAHIQNLIDTWSGADNEIVSSSFDGIACPPILFPKGAFSALSELQGDNGAKSLLANDKFVVSSIDFPPAKFDVDRPEDLQRSSQD
jgi:molybdenum cofactor cytidylyltransferase